tara:strand:- start:300 stop:497 length:198 start_codon:yes stop_codon:yes gene_type:complete
MSVLTTPQAITYLNGPKAEGERHAIGAETLTRLAAEGKVRALRTGRGWLFATEALDAWLAAGMQS